MDEPVKTERVKRGGNRRTTGKRMRGIEAKQVPWRQDPIILDRIRVGAAPWLEGRSPAECLAVVNQYLAARYPDEPPIAKTALYEDRQHFIELRKEQAPAAADHHLAEYDHAMEEAWRAFRDTKNQSLNKSAFLSLIAGIVERKAKLDGSLRPDAATVQVNIESAQVEIVAVALDASLDEAGISTEQRFAILQGMAKRLKGNPQGSP